MKRYPAFDPPEYVDWSPEPEILESYRQTVRKDPERTRRLDDLSRGQLLQLYGDLLRTRLLDIGLKRWVRRGVISKAWLGTGEEAVTVGSVFALDRRRDVVCPMIRNAGACHMMGMPLTDLFLGYLATPDSPSGGRDLHVGDPERGVIQPISHMGTNVPVMAGVALGFVRRGEDRVALTWIGDGATKTGECHEGLNFAAVQDLPVVFVLQNNQIALGTPLHEHGAGDLRRWGDMYGIPTHEADGNNVLDVYSATALAVERCRRGRGPAMVVAETFRMGGHATHDEREARETFPEELFQYWGKRDPVGLYEAWLEESGVDSSVLRKVEEEVTREVETAARQALESRDDPGSPERALYEGVSEGGPSIGVARRPFQTV